MSATKKSATRGRPRQFDVEAALEAAEALFHAHGYEAVSVAQLTEALGINPPSFYAAFGSKAALFERVLDRYSTHALPVDETLRDGRDPAEALAELLAIAARTYCADPARPGCMVIEHAREATALPHARELQCASRDRLRDYVAATRPERARAIGDFVTATMVGMSGAAREGLGCERLSAVAALAGAALPAMLAG